MDIEIMQTMNEYPRWVEDYSATPVRLSENVQVMREVNKFAFCDYLFHAKRWDIMTEFEFSEKLVHNW